MNFIDRWPSTPYKQFTGWCAFVLFFLFSLAALWAGKAIEMGLWYGLAALVLGYNGDGTLQFFAKRKTAYEPPQAPPTVNVEAGSTVNVEAPKPPTPVPVVLEDPEKDETVERPQFSPGGA